MKIYSPPAAAIDWQSFGDCIITNRWTSALDLEEHVGLSHGTAQRAWHGKPIGLIPFLRICKKSLPALQPLRFLMER